MVGKRKVVAWALILFCSIQPAAWAAAPPNLKSNRVQISYVPPSNPAHQHIYEVLQQGRVLERMKGI